MDPSLLTRLLDAVVLTLILTVPSSSLACIVAWTAGLPVLPQVASSIGSLLLAGLLSGIGGHLASVLNSRISRRSSR